LDRATYLKACPEFLQVGNEPVVRMQLNLLLPKLGAYTLADLGRVNEKVNTVGCDHRIGKENRVKVDVRSPQVE
jgi:hypothetical protein